MNWSFRSDRFGKDVAMKTLTRLALLVLLLTLLVSCTYFRKENPLNLKCPACGYQWDQTIRR